VTETVTDIIVSRGRAEDGLSSMVVWSLGAHAALVALMLLWPAPAPEAPKTIMTVSLGGAPGPKTGGLNQIGSRAVQAPAPEPAKEVEAPPAPKTPPMTLPDPKSPPRARRKVEEAPPESTSRTASTGERPREGTSAAVRGTGFGTGLSSSGGSGGGVQLDVSDFCCPEYIDQMRIVILRIWEQNQGVRGSNTMKFTITRAGSVQTPQVEMPSGFVALDNASLRVLQRVTLPPLPAAFPNPTLTVHMRFDYQ
jgi:TonB family protein